MQAGDAFLNAILDALITTILTNACHNASTSIDRLLLGVSKSLSPSVAKVSRRNEGDDAVEDKERNEDAEIPPAIIEGDIEASGEIVTDTVLAVVAGTGSVGILQVTASRLNKGSCPLLAGLTSGCRECSEFLWLAVDVKVVQLRRDQTADQTGERIEIVHPFSVKQTEYQLLRSDARDEAGTDRQNPGSCGWGMVTPQKREKLQVSVSTGTITQLAEGCSLHDQKEWVDCAGDEDRGRQGTDSLTQSHRVELGDQNHEEGVASSITGTVEARGVPHKDPVREGAEYRIRRFRKELSGREDVWAVHTTRGFSCESDSRHDVHRLDLGYDDL